MIYPFHFSFSTLISAFYDTACEIIVENNALSAGAYSAAG
jgi:hypothetical protein